MWCDRVLGNLDDAPQAWPDRAIDPVEVAWNACRRVLRATSRAGTPVRVLLPPGQRLRHADILADDGKTLTVLHVLPCELIVVRPPDARTMALLALELGNLHWPTEVTASEVLFPEDGPPLEALKKLGLSHERQIRRFTPAATIVTTNAFTEQATDASRVIVLKPTEKPGS